MHSIPEPTPSTMTALHQFGAEMLKLSRGLESFSPISEPSNINSDTVDLSNVIDEEPSINKLEQASTDDYRNIKIKEYVLKSLKYKSINFHQRELFILQCEEM